MSGGAFNYVQYRLDDVIQKLSHQIEAEDNFSEETLRIFGEAIIAIAKARIFIQRIDWLLSGDDSEEVFHARLEGDLNGL